MRKAALIDLDPQASAADYFGLYARAQEGSASAVELTFRGRSIAECACETGVENLWCVPTSLELYGQNELMLSEQCLRFALDAANRRAEVLERWVISRACDRREAFEYLICRLEGAVFK